MARVKKKRVGFLIDMTPLVDITFLLLTFFMFTAKFKSEAEAEQKFVIDRPEASADTSKIPEKDLAVIKIAIDSVDQDTTYYYEVLNETDRTEIWEQSAEYLTAQQLEEAQLEVTTEVLNELVANTKLVNNDTKFAIDADESLQYRYISEAMDILRRNRATQFNYVTEKKEGM